MVKFCKIMIFLYLYLLLNIDKGMKEVWKACPDYEGLYEVSNLGRIRSVDRIVLRNGNPMKLKGKVLTTTKQWSGHLNVCVCKNGVCKNIRLHRFIARAFIPNPLNLPEVNHKDENPANNRANNLEWCDHKYNMNYGTIIERRLKKISHPVVQMTKDGIDIATFCSTREAERITGIFHHNIAKCAKGKRHYKTAGGYKWRFGNDC